MRSPYAITLDEADRQAPEALARSGRAEHRRVPRARIVLAAADGWSNAGIARELRILEDTVRRWRRRFRHEGLPGLADRPRVGRPRVFPAAVVAEVKAPACEPPTQSDMPLARWSCPEPAREAVARGVCKRVSASTVRRRLAADAIKPWQHRSWIFPRDPYFAVKAARVLDLYSRVREGEPLGENDFVPSADGKPGVRARYRLHVTLAAGAHRPMRVESEYSRGGTPAYFAAYDVRHARVIGRCEPTTGIVPFSRLVDQVMTTEPYAGARRVFWIVDDRASHRNWAATARMNDAFPNAHLVRSPVHASWLNQVEIYFSAVQRKALTPDDFGDLDEATERLMSFQEHYNATAQPFDWTFTRHDLNRLLTRIGRHDRHAPQPPTA
ncbi:IS630 family transposase [Saccharothrix luteola]|uniref:IS630 family transposase n=1 Tax=Saccharothrix luteola TaxID=2893018 RepID=UPI001E4302CA|nr:IS630 family transposase [Saccharothrix luteola]MCC8246257.1 IS630 family transposase [Saccharothrix luteola]